MPKQVFWKRVEKFPPILCRLLARRKPGGPPVTTAELVVRTGLSEMQVVALSNQFDWRGVDVPTMRKFIGACGVDFENPQQMKRATVYLAGKRVKGHQIPARFDYLRKSPEWEKTYLPLMIRLKEYAQLKVQG